MRNDALRRKRTKLCFVGLSVVAVPAILLSRSVGEAGAPWVIRSVVLLLIVAWWLSPLALYWWSAQTLPSIVAIGVGYPIAASAGLLAIFASESSTAGIGILTIPVLLWGGVAAVVIAEAFALSSRGRREA